MTNMLCKGIQTKKHPLSPSASVSTNIHGIPTMCQLGAFALSHGSYSASSLSIILGSTCHPHFTDENTEPGGPKSTHQTQ